LSETRKESISTIKIIMLIVLLSIAGLLPAHISVTLTPSLSHRVFFLIFNPDRNSIRKGDYIMIYMNKQIASQLSDKPDTDRIMKIVGCMSGSFLTVVKKDYFCENEYLGKAKDVSLAGKPVSNFVFNGTIPSGSLFVIGQHKDSFDSRYFGFVDSRTIIAKAFPIF
jgi:conjugal transfer pilin signal peptidase TrbI